MHDCDAHGFYFPNPQSGASASSHPKSVTELFSEWNGLTPEDIEEIAPQGLPNLSTQNIPAEFEGGEGAQGSSLGNPNFIDPTHQVGYGTSPSHDSSSPAHPHLEDKFSDSPDENAENPPDQDFDDFGTLWPGVAGLRGWISRWKGCIMNYIKSWITYPHLHFIHKQFVILFLNFVKKNFIHLKGIFFLSLKALRN